MSPMLKLPLAMEHALLGFLLREPLHAYEIHRQLDHNHDLGLVWHLKQSLVYVLLEKLEAEGYLTTSTEPQGNRPPRKLLHITPAGRAAFDRWLNAPVEHGRDFRQEFLAKLFFAQQADDPGVLAQLIAAGLLVRAFAPVKRTLEQAYLEEVRKPTPVTGEAA